MYQRFVICLIVVLLMLGVTDGLHPDTFLPTEKLVGKYGYPFEAHEIITKDGYIISIFRIPHGKSGSKPNTKPVLMMHGIFGQAEAFIANGMNNGSWAYYMADNGYDVWLGNTRGNRYGKRHLVLEPTKKEFWNFSFHEMGMIDLPAMIDYILELTGKSRLDYIATSQGCTIFYVMCSLKQEYQRKITIASFLAPAGYMKHFAYPLIIPLTVFQKQFQKFSERIGFFEISPASSPFFRLISTVCSYLLHKQCVQVYHILLGGNSGRFNEEMLPLLLRILSSGSVKQLVHFLQIISSGHFRPFDYGRRNNMKIYGKLQPDDYPLEKIEVPIAMYYSIGDVIVNYKDIEETCDALPNCVRKFIMPNKKWNHLDFTFATNLSKDLIEPAVKFSQEYDME